MCVHKEIEEVKKPFLSEQVKNTVLKGMLCELRKQTHGEHPMMFYVRGPTGDLGLNPEMHIQEDRKGLFI